MTALINVTNSTTGYHKRKHFQDPCIKNDSHLKVSWMCTHTHQSDYQYRYIHAFIIRSETGWIADYSSIHTYRIQSRISTASGHGQENSSQYLDQAVLVGLDPHTKSGWLIVVCLDHCLARNKIFFTYRSSKRLIVSTTLNHFSLMNQCRLAKLLYDILLN